MINEFTLEDPYKKMGLERKYGKNKNPNRPKGRGINLVGIFKVADTIESVSATKNPTIASDGVFATNEKISDKIMEKIEFYNRFGKLLEMIYNPNKIVGVNDLVEEKKLEERKDLVSKVEEEIQVREDGEQKVEKTNADKKYEKPIEPKPVEKKTEQKSYAKAEIYAPKKAEETKEYFSYQTLRETQKALQRGIKNIKKHLREAKGMKHQIKCFKELDKMLSTIKELD